MNKMFNRCSSVGFYRRNLASACGLGVQVEGKHDILPTTTSMVSFAPKRRTEVRAQLSFWEERNLNRTTTVWETLTTEQQAEVVATLARLIVKLILATDHTENDDE